MSWVSVELNRIKTCTEEQDTLELQFECLEQFLIKLGYAFVIQNNYVFQIRKILDNTNPEYMSLEKAVQIYNGTYTTWRCLGKDSTIVGEFIFNNKDLDEAYRSRYIERVKLQRSKDKLVVSDNMVKIMNKGE